jgi:hypothetical protein
MESTSQVTLEILHIEPAEFAGLLFHFIKRRPPLHSIVESILIYPSLYLVPLPHIRFSLNINVEATVPSLAI